MKPNFLVIGAARSGTTALMTFIGSHPQVFTTAPKEPHFFAFANTSQNFSGPGDEEMMNRVIVSDPAKYEQLFSKKGEAVAFGEGSVSSLYYPETAIGNIKRYASPDVKLIVLLRDPIDRAFSSYLYLRSRGHESIDNFRDALRAEGTRRDLGWHHMWHYSNMSLYGQQLPHFVQAFGADRLLVLSHDELNVQPQQTLATVFEFLGVRSIEVDTNVEINRSGEPNNMLLHRAQMLARRNESTKRFVKRLVPLKLREQLRSANLFHPSMDPAIRAELRAMYAEDALLLRSAEIAVPLW